MKKSIMKTIEAFSFVVGVMCGSLMLTSCGGGDDGGAGSGSGGSGDNTGAIPVKTRSRALAFPGAEGGASTITGGSISGGSVYIVTNTNNAGTGSLRDAVSMSGRTIVFAVSGTINLETNLNITAKNLTIAGQTAPGDGICIAGYPVKFTNTENIIVRYVRFRLGDQNVDKSNFDADAGDALEVKDSKDIMIDHCSMSWSTDECASFSRVENLTVQYCIISESLKLSGHSKGNHGYGGIWGGKNVSYHHNLLADHDSRNPRFDHEYVGGNYRGPINYINNVVYNWGGNSTYGGEAKPTSTPFHINMENNFYKPGPSSSHTGRLIEITTMCGNCATSSPYQCTPAQLYINGNYVNGIANKDWDGVDFGKSTKVNSKTYNDSRSNETLLNLAKLNSRYTTSLTLLTYIESAQEAYESVLTYAGASLKRDDVDNRIVNQVKNNTGAIINKVSDTAGYPTLNSTTASEDLDKDGMPDAWEEQQLATLGVTGKTYKDFRPNIYNLSSKYTNLEVYLNSLVVNTFPAGAGASEIK